MYCICHQRPGAPGLRRTLYIMNTVRNAEQMRAAEESRE